MTYEALVPLLIGPAGALILLAIGVVVLWKENRRLTEKLESEKSTRLKEALENAKALEHWNNELHTTVKSLTALFHQVPSQGPVRISHPGSTNLTSTHGT